MDVVKNKTFLTCQKRKGEEENFISKKLKRDGDDDDEDDFVGGIRDLYVDEYTLPGMRKFFKRFSEIDKLVTECHIEQYMSPEIFGMHSDMIFEFLQSYGNLVSVVGPPGCGKTHMIFDLCYKFFIRCGIVPNIIAQSQKIVENINDRIDARIEVQKKKEKEVDWERFLPRASTCCSFLGIRRNLIYDLEKDIQTFIKSYERRWQKELNLKSYEEKKGLPEIVTSEMIILDEQSLIGGHFMAIMDYICRKWKKTDQLFGGIPVVLLGDPCQLVPVNGISSYLSKPFVEGALNYSSINRIVRCKDDPVLKTLIMAMREDAEVPESLLKRVNYSCVIGVNLNDPNVCPGNLRIFCKNNTMNKYLETLTKTYLKNQKKKTFPITYSWKRQDKVIRNRYMTDVEKTFLNEVKKRLTEELRVGMDVMIKTNVYGQYINGEQGIIEDFIDEGVIFRNHKNKRKIVKMAEKELHLGNKVKFCVLHMPLHQANAVTAHTCQGQTGNFAVTEECMKMNTQSSFAGGTYVCISRASCMGTREEKLNALMNEERTVKGLFLASELGKKTPVSPVHFVHKRFFENSNRIFLPKYINPIHVHFFLEREKRIGNIKYTKHELNEITLALKNQKL